MLSHSSFARERFPAGESLFVESSQLTMQEDQILHNAKSDQMLAACPRPLMQERRLKPHGDQILKCPRCDSLNTKFCYYNNYSLTQPRHFCKNCKRYWTKGGALRNVPVGGGCRKNKRIKQRTADQAASSVTAEEAIMRAGDGSSSSSPLQHDFCSSTGAAAAASSPGVYATSPGLYATDEGEHLGLAFERLDQTTRAFSVSSAPISLKWAPAQELPSATPAENLHPFDSNILALTLTGHLKQNTGKRLQNGELSSMFDPQLNLLAAPVSTSLNDNLAPYNFCLEGFGVPSSNGDHLQWRLPPRLVTMTEDASKGKLSLECMPISTEIDTANQTSSPDWHPPADGFFEATGDTGSYWASGSWPPDMTMYGNMAGSQLL